MVKWKGLTVGLLNYYMSLKVETITIIFAMIAKSQKNPYGCLRTDHWVLHYRNTNRPTSGVKV